MWLFLLHNVAYYASIFSAKTWFIVRRKNRCSMMCIMSQQIDRRQHSNQLRANFTVVLRLARNSAHLPTVFVFLLSCWFFAHKGSMVLASEFPLLWLPTAGNLIDNDFRKAIIYIMKSIYDLSMAFYFNFNNASAFVSFAWVYIMALCDFV